MGHHVLVQRDVGSSNRPLPPRSVGIWTGRLQRRTTAEAIETVNELDELGYSAVWVPESPFGKNVLTFSAVLLGASANITVATGIAIVWARDPVAMMNAGRTIGDAHPGRFVLGIGISHESTALARGHDYRVLTRVDLTRAQEKPSGSSLRETVRVGVLRGKGSEDVFISDLPPHTSRCILR